MAQLKSFPKGTASGLSAQHLLDAKVTIINALTICSTVGYCISTP